MSPDYSELAARRASKVSARCMQPEDFGYDFREWVSPYTKSAHAGGGIAIVLQDWASEDFLNKGFNSDIQTFGRQPSLATNKRLDEVLRRVLGLRISDVYVTNVFPFIKPGAMSAGIKLRHVVETAKEFTAPELEIAQPTIALALGSLTHKALSRAGVESIPLPHPSKRGMSFDVYESLWREVFG